VTAQTAAARLDAVSPTPHDIQTKEFRESFRGYNQDDVDAFLDELAEEIARLTQESQRLRVQVAALQQEVARAREGAPPAMAFEPHDKDEAREEAKRALAAAQSAAEALLQEARAQADEVIAEAERKAADAERNVADAERRAEEAEERAARAPSDAMGPYASASSSPSPSPEGSDAAEIEWRVQELERHEAEVRQRLRDLLEEELQAIDRFEAQSHQKATVQRMSRELGEGGDEAEPNVRRFWREPNS
jgi:DivIVA domain-containing protein